MRKRARVPSDDSDDAAATLEQPSYPKTATCKMGVGLCNVNLRRTPLLDLRVRKSSCRRTFPSKGCTLIEHLQPLEDIDRRLRLADLSEIAEALASRREFLAALQENDTGKWCHCPCPQPSRPVGEIYKLLMEW